ncbi:MAG: outer membrane beta-barrel domain-containing protein [Bdellovibrionales bacterium]
MRTLSQYVLLATLCYAQSAQAQSKQYQRPKSSTPKVDAGALTAPVAKDSADKEAATDKKVDITDLEKKYWIPKDTEFQVVQNRTYTKANKIAITPSLGSLLSDPYSKAVTYSLAVNYYFSERHGLELNYINLDSKNTALTDEFVNTYTAVPDHNKIKSYYGLAYTWIPIYAKLSLLEKQIIYFDMSFTIGAGLTRYEQQYLYETATSKTAPTLALDVAQHYFLSQHFALRVDLKNRLFNEEIKNARVASEVRRTKFNHTAIFMIGLSYYFN